MDQEALSGPDFSKGDGLLPVVAQDVASGDVLMLAYMNRESYDETLRTRRAVWSQSASITTPAAPEPSAAYENVYQGEYRGGLDRRDAWR